MAMILVAILEN